MFLILTFFLSFILFNQSLNVSRDPFYIADDRRWGRAPRLKTIEKARLGRLNKPCMCKFLNPPFSFIHSTLRTLMYDVPYSHSFNFTWCRVFDFHTSRSLWYIHNLYHALNVYHPSESGGDRRSARRSTFLAITILISPSQRGDERRGAAVAASNPL